MQDWRKGIGEGHLCGEQLHVLLVRGDFLLVCIGSWGLVVWIAWV